MDGAAAAGPNSARRGGRGGKGRRGEQQGEGGGKGRRGEQQGEPRGGARPEPERRESERREGKGGRRGCRAGAAAEAPRETRQSVVDAPPAVIFPAGQLSILRKQPKEEPAAGHSLAAAAPHLHPQPVAPSAGGTPDPWPGSPWPGAPTSGGSAVVGAGSGAPAASPAGTSVAPPSLAARPACARAGRPFRVIDDALRWCLPRDAGEWASQGDNASFRVVGAVGQQGAGKSFVLNALLGGSSAGAAPLVFTEQDAECRSELRHCTRGVQGCFGSLGAERVLLLDCQPLLSSSVLVELATGAGSAATEPMLAELALRAGEGAARGAALRDLQLVVWLLSVCDVLLVVEDAQCAGSATRALGRLLRMGYLCKRGDALGQDCADLLLVRNRADGAAAAAETLREQQRRWAAYFGDLVPHGSARPRFRLATLAAGDAAPRRGSDLLFLRRLLLLECLLEQQPGHTHRAWAPGTTAGERACARAPAPEQERWPQGEGKGEGQAPLLVFVGDDSDSEGQDEEEEAAQARARARGALLAPQEPRLEFAALHLLQRDLGSLQERRPPRGARPPGPRTNTGKDMGTGTGTGTGTPAGAAAAGRTPAGSVAAAAAAGKPAVGGGSNPGKGAVRKATDKAFAGKAPGKAAGKSAAGRGGPPAGPRSDKPKPRSIASPPSPPPLPPAARPRRTEADWAELAQRLWSKEIPESSQMREFSAALEALVTCVL